MDSFKKLDSNSNISNEVIFTDYWTHTALQQEVSKGALLRLQKPQRPINDIFYDRINIKYDQPSTSKANQLEQIFRGKPYCRIKKLKNVKSPKRCPLRVAELATPTKRQCIESWRYNSRVLPDYMVDRLKQRVMDQKPIAQITDAITCFKSRKKNTLNRPRKASCVPNNCKQMREIIMLTAIFGFKLIAKLLRPINISLNPRLTEINKVVKKEIEVLLQGDRRSHRKRIQTADEDIIDEMAGKITLWIDSILVDMKYKLLEESLRELEDEEGPVLDFIDDVMDRVANICMPYTYEPSDKSIEKVGSESTMSLLESSLDVPKDQIDKEFIEEIFLEVLDKVNPSPYEVLDFENKIETSIDDIDDEDTVNNYKEQIQTLLEQIVGNIIVDEFQIEEKVGGKNDTGVEFSYKNNVHDNIENISLDLKSDENVNNNGQDALDFTDENNKTVIQDGIVNDQLISSFNEDNDENSLIKISMNDNYDKIESKSNIENDQQEIEKMTDLENSKIETEFTEDSQSVVKSEAVSELEPLSETNKLESTEENEELPKDAKSDQQDIDDDLKFSDAEDGEIKLTPEDAENTDKHIIELSKKTEELESIDDNAEDKNKKVKFSNIDMGLGIGSLDGIRHSAQEILARLSSRENYKSDMDLAPPNDHLLSPADESWPQHLPLPTLKVTESVNKSVTSLGKIFEADEKGNLTTSSSESVPGSDILIDHQPFTSMPFQSEKEIDADKKSLEPNERERDSKNKIGKNQLPDKKNNKSDHVMKNRGKTENVTKSKSQGSVKAINKVPKIQNKSDKQIKNKISQENYRRIHINEAKVKKQTNISKYFKKGLAENIVNIEGADIKAKAMKKEKALKSDFKKPKKVINDMSRNNNERKLKKYSDKKSLSTAKGTKPEKIGNLDNDAIFKWCKGLENVIDNLETWNAWMYSTCACIKYLKQKDMADNFQSPRSIEKARKKWKMLHKNIKQDRILWHDMRRRNRDGLNSYKRYYHENGADKSDCEICDCSNI